MDTEVKALLVKVFPDEVELLGDQLVDGLLKQGTTSDHLDLPGDDRFDLANVYDFIAAAGKVGEKLIRRYDEWKLRHSTTKFKFSVEDALIEITTADQLTKEMIAKRLDQLIAAVESRHAPRSPD